MVTRISISVPASHVADETSSVSYRQASGALITVKGVRLEEAVVTLTSAKAFTAFAKDAGERVRRALIAAYGPELGIEATAEALAYGWEHWDRISAMDNPAGYLYRVGRTRARGRLRRRPAPVPVVDSTPGEAWVEPGLPESLSRLTRKQRASVVLVHGYGWSYQEASRIALGLLETRSIGFQLVVRRRIGHGRCLRIRRVGRR